MTRDRLPPWVAEALDPGEVMLVSACTPEGAATLAGVKRADVSRFPTVVACVQEALRSVGSLPPACRHVLAGTPAWQGGPRLCAQHPEVGLLCRDCSAPHIDGHDPLEERRCDGCDTVVERIRGVILALPVRVARVRGLDGRKRQVPGPVMLGGLGLCLPCFNTSRRR